MGLVGYEEGQTLYGRDSEVSLLSHLIEDNNAVVVYGKSGIGKSSLLKAGVFPVLRERAFVPLYIRLNHNTDESYAVQIEKAIKDQKSGIKCKDRLGETVPDLGLWDFLHRNEFTNSEGQSVIPVIVLDQFEEIYTLSDTNHKVDFQEFFSQLADVLNETKPDVVLEEERKFVEDCEAVSNDKETTGFTLKPVAKTKLKYSEESQFRIVICLRDDSLYLLERSCATIPSLKANRFNLNALGEEAAKDVIVKPAPGYIAEEQCQEIIEHYSEFSNDGDKVVDPAIISLFLYLYYENKRKVSYENIFEKYYVESIQSVSTSSMSRIEDELLTEEGYRRQLPEKQLLAEGVLASELEYLEKCIILKKEKGYVEFSHDLLGKEALKHKSQRQAERSKKRFRILISSFLAILAGVLFSVWALWPKPPVEVVTLKLQILEGEGFGSNESWEVDFQFLALSKDSVLILPVQGGNGMALESLKAYKRSAELNEFQITVPKEFIDREKHVRIKLYNPTANCRAVVDTVSLQQWKKEKTWKMFVKHIEKIQFEGTVVTEDGMPLEKALVVLGNQSVQETGTDGRFRFFLEDSAALNNLYVFKQGYENEHIIGGLQEFCRDGVGMTSLLVPMKSSSSKKTDIDFKELFKEQLYAVLSLYKLAEYNNRKGDKPLTADDSLCIDSVIKVFPDYALNLKKLRRTNKKTADGKIDVYCISVENAKVGGIRDVVGNFLMDRKNHVFKGKLLRTGQPDCWRLSAIAWDRENNQYVIQGVLENVSIEKKGVFIKEKLEKYEPWQYAV